MEDGGSQYSRTNRHLDNPSHTDSPIRVKDEADS